MLDGKNSHKSLVHIFDLNCFESMLHTIVFQASVLSFFISVAEVFLKNSLVSVVLFFTDSAPSFRSFANLNLAFSLQKLLGNQEK